MKIKSDLSASQLAQTSRLRVRVPSRCPNPELVVRRRQNQQPRRLGYRSDPHDLTRGIVFAGHLTPDFKTADPEKFHLHAGIYFDHFIPSNITIRVGN